MLLNLLTIFLVGVVDIDDQLLEIGGGLGAVVPILVRCQGVHQVIVVLGKTLALSSVLVTGPGIRLDDVQYLVNVLVPTMCQGTDPVLGKYLLESVHE